MYKSILLTILLATGSVSAQETIEKTLTERQGFVFGVGVGGGMLTLSTNNSSNVAFSSTLPNIKIGYMLSKRLALLSLLPGANYRYNEKPRGFEAFQIAGQYWLSNKWWTLVGAGLTFDAPAFYSVEDPKTAEFNFGFPALSIASGYEVWHKGKFALDIQYRFFIGRTNLKSGGVREGFSNMLILGFNWY